jgi:hypothetical protein
LIENRELKVKSRKAKSEDKAPAQKAAATQMNQNNTPHATAACGAPAEKEKDDE